MSTEIKTEQALRYRVLQNKALSIPDSEMTPAIKDFFVALSYYFLDDFTGDFAYRSADGEIYDWHKDK